MSDNNQELANSGIFNKFISVVALIAAALYFTGWIYRWSYFSFFQVNALSLDFGVQSYYIAAFQALFAASPWTALRTVIAVLVTLIAILVTLLFLRYVTKSFLRITFLYSIKLPRTLSLIFSLGDEIIIVLWFLVMFFYLAQWQGDEDAWIDAVNETSTLPVVTLINPADGTPLGNILDDLSSLPDPNKFRIIGDMQRYKNLTDYDDTNYDDTKLQESRVWRLLLEGKDTAYLFPAMPKGKPRNFRPPVLIVKTSNVNNQMMIISPEVYKK